MKTRPTTYDQEKVKMLRMEVILACIDVMQEAPSVKKWPKYKQDLVLKMAPRILPTLHAGRDDDRDLMPQPLLGGQSIHGNNGNNSHTEATQAQEKD